MPLIDLDALTARDASASDMWAALLAVAVGHHASDIHLTSQEDGLHAAFRIDGELVPQGRIPPGPPANRLRNHIKVTGDLDLGEQRRPQDGRAFAELGERTVDLRISALPTNHGQDIVIRILDRTVSMLDVEQLGLGRRLLNRLLGLINSPNGLILVTGPTGAGKTTTLYAILNRLNNGTRKIITLENPVEYDLPGINQAQVNYRLGIDYGVLLRTVLRQDPNIIMIGEVRDAETANAAVRAAVTGHLVFATMHAVEAAAAVESLISLGAHPHFLAWALRGVIAQNLVRQVCPDCTERIDETAAVLPLDEIKDLIGPGETPALAMGKGCDKCHRSGYRGRIGLFEILVSSDEIRTRIEQRRPAREIREAALKAGMLSLQQAGKLAAFQGRTTVEELIRTLSI